MSVSKVGTMSGRRLRQERLRCMERDLVVVFPKIPLWPEIAISPKIRSIVTLILMSSILMQVTHSSQDPSPTSPSQPDPTSSVPPQIQQSPRLGLAPFSQRSFRSSQFNLRTSIWKSSAFGRSGQDVEDVGFDERERSEQFGFGERGREGWVVEGWERFWCFE